MALELFLPDSPRATRERIVIYGRAGIGKSRFALMLPDTEKWGEILYYAADDSAENLDSIPASARSRIHVVKPRGSDHLRNFQQFCMQDWQNILDPKTKKPLAEQPYRNVKTLVVDTFSTIAFRVIQQIANENFIDREEHYWIGSKEEGGWALPSRSDYQGIENASKGFIETLFDKQRNMNVVFVCHEDQREIGKGRFVGGPSVPGRRMLEDLPASFNTVIRLIREPIMIPGASTPKPAVVAVTDNDGNYVAKLREGDVDGNPLGRVVLERYPLNFWNRHDSR